MEHAKRLGIDARAPLIGRTEEITILEDAVRAVLEKGETRIVSVIGPSGVGKTRLLQEVLGRHKIGPSAIRVYRGSSRDLAAAYGQFGRLLRARFGLVEGMDNDAAKAKVREEVTRVTGDRKVGDVLYFLGQLLGLPFDESPLTRALRDEPQQAELLRRAVLKAFLEADAAMKPMCLVLEDLHFAHEDSLALLRYLLEYVTGPILVLVAAREELLARDEDWSTVGEKRHTVIELGALSEADAAAMMEALLAPCAHDGNVIPKELVDSACTFAAGNPLYLEQMVRIFHDTGVLHEETSLTEEHVWTVNLDKLHTARLPLTIEDAVNARLAALDADEKTLLEQAAAMGSVFWSGAFIALGRAGKEAPDLWSATSEEDVEETQAILDDLVERDYVLRLPDSTFAGSEEYVFKHNKEREALAKRTAAGAARRHHQVIAEWLDHQRGVHQNEEHLSMLAEHREKGGDNAGAGLAYLEAGDLARRRYANARASEYYEKGLTLLGEHEAYRRIDALHNLGDVLVLMGQVDDALAAFREMLTLAYRLDLKGKGGAAHNRIGRAYRDIGALDDAAKHLATGLELFKAAEDDRGIASSIDDIGKLYWLKGEYDKALGFMRDALARRRALADRRSIALSFNNLGLVLQDSGMFKEALDAFEQSLHIRREIGDLVGLVTTLNNLGTIAQDQRDFPRAVQFLQEALEVAEQIGNRNRIALVLTNLGEVYYRSGALDTAISTLQRAEGLCDELGDKLGLAEVLRGLGKAHLLRGDLVKARDAIGRAVDLFASVRSKVHLGAALRTLGEITAAGGWGTAHTKSAREYFARSVAIFEQTGNDIELGRTFKVFAKFLVTEPEFASDPNARRDAEGMDARADQIFARLRVSSSRSPSFTSEVAAQGMMRGSAPSIIAPESAPLPVIPPSEKPQ
ncbi:MAG: tetratricopeptide repeat protein [Polyangiaceae bacterium]